MYVVSWVGVVEGLGRVYRALLADVEVEGWVTLGLI